MTPTALRRQPHKPNPKQQCRCGLRHSHHARSITPCLVHADPAFTLRVYAHALREEETDLSFADFGEPRRPNTAQSEKGDFEESPNPLIEMARREGFEPPTLRFEESSEDEE